MDIKKRGLILVVVSLFFLIFALSLVSAENSGCYTYPKASEDFYCKSSVLESEAKADCDANPGCKLGDYFYPAKDCSQFEQCKSVKCTVDCQTHALGKCQNLGGNEIPEGEIDAWCNLGCCKIEKIDFCQANMLKSACLSKAKQKGITNLDQDVFFYNPKGMTKEKCNSEYCKIETKKAVLTGFVKDDKDQPISGAVLVLEGITKIEKKTEASGKYLFESLMPGTFLIKITKENFSPKSLTLTLKGGETLDQNITLSSQAGQFKVSGKVTDKNEKAIPGATVSWKGAATGIASVDETSKEYQAVSLPAGSYIFTAGAPGFKKSEIELIIAGDAILDFSLEKSALQVITGKTYLDVDGDNILDSEDTPLPDAQIYLDEIFKGRSTYPNGIYEIGFTLASGQEETHQLSAVFQEYSSLPVSIPLAPGQSFTQDILLTTYKGECSEPGSEKDVEKLTTVPVPGKKEIQLSLNKPCPEVIAYEIKRLKGESVELVQSLSFLENNYLDNDPKLKWGEEYTYQIIAIYDHGPQKNPTISEKVSTGNKFCEGKYNSELGQWANFCIVGEKAEMESNRKMVWSCNNQNQLIVNSNCQDQGENFYCAKLSETEAFCKDVGPCSNPFNNLFGLYYQKETCYGEGNKNFCFYDFTEKTIVDKCQRCTEIQSCFNYKSQDACQTNNCLSSKCKWVSGANNDLQVNYQLVLPGLVTPETGVGYCTEEKYPNDDQCTLCSPSATLFENYYCTTDICSALGRCFSLTELKECRACGDFPSDKSNCYNYGTEFECTNKKAGITKGLYSDISFSEDRCGWERCIWQGIPNGAGSCIKDGDGDFTDGNTDECTSFGDPNLNLACKIDNSPPRTKIDPEGVNTVSTASPNLVFIGQDNFHESELQNNALGVLGICLESIDPKLPIFCTKDQFVETNYPRKQKEEQLIVNLINSTFLQNSQINGETYRLKYYSKDKYFNQENLQTAYIFLDNVIPQFEINEIKNTVGDITSLTAFLEKVDEKMECTFKLDQIIPKGETRTEFVARDIIEKKVVFENLQGVSFNLNVTCKDDANNLNTITKSYIFNLDQNIEIVYPEFNGMVNKLEIPFKIKTTVGATCGLYLTATNEKVADFVTNEEGKVHQTPVIPGFYEKEYNGDYKTICKEFFSDKTHEALFQFKVDFTPPETQIVLKEGLREEKPLALGMEEWELYFIKSAQISFECQAEGFSCDKTYYCLGDNCEFVGASGYTEYTQPFDLNNSDKICYYSTDLGKNIVYNPTCGKIIIDGYGITLISPELYYYLDEVFGISNQPKFVWKFSTRVPTTECRFDYVSGFDYESIPVHKARVPLGGENKYTYLFENFPESVLSDYPENGGIKSIYIKCKNLEGEVGPEQKFNLEYDPSFPEIIQSYAEPDKVLEGIVTNLFAETDDKTLCKYSDNSEGQGSSEYLTMEYSFPKTEEKKLDQIHQDVFEINFVSPDGKKDYSLNTQCKNGAGDFSEAKTITFSVDYAEKGYIVEGTLLPSGYITSKTIPISLETSKTAYCEFDLGDGQANRPFTDGQGAKVHSTILGNLTEKDYLIPVKCTMGDYSTSAQIKFTVDWTAPKINQTDDGNKTCGSESIKLFVYTNENKLAKYSYELYDLGEQVFAAPSSNKPFGNATKTMPIAGSSQKIMIKNETIDAVQPLEISTSILNESHKYSFKIKAQDAAGNWGDFAESDGVLVTAKNVSSCTEDKSAPEVTFKINDSSCTKSMAEMFCKDASQCTIFKYIQQADSKNCQNFSIKSNNSFSYNGQKLEFFKSGWICYFAGDAMGNNLSNNKEISFPDKDGDGVRDVCDKCKDTGTGKKVDTDGCDGDNPSPIENKTDTDGDKLPDYWEKLHSQDDCELNYLAKDSDDDGLADYEEDYDGDGMNNYQEYLGYFDPCLADKPKPGPGPEPGPKPVPPEPLPPKPSEEGDLLAWIFLILGLLLFLGGMGYLIYYYLYSPGGKTGTGKGRISGSIQSSEVLAKAPIPEVWKEKLMGMKKARAEKLKARRKEEVFGEFSSESKEFPHISELLQKKVPSISQLSEVAKKYVEHKEEIQPGLKREEKSIFSKLEEIGKQQAKGSKVSEVVSKEEAEDIFSKLKDISKKRKGGKNV